MPEGTLASKGQVAIPVELQRKLGLQAGDRLHFDSRDGGAVVRPKKKPLTSVVGILRRLGQKTVSVAEMESAVLKDAGQWWDRTQQ